MRRVADLSWLLGYAAGVTRRGGSTVPERLRRGLRLSGISFRYPGTERWVLRNLDLELPAGSVVALVGENGAGKTSLVKLLCAMYDPTEGTITVDGADIADFAHETGRRAGRRLPRTSCGSNCWPRRRWASAICPGSTTRRRH